MKAVHNEMETYRKSAVERAAAGLPPLPLTAAQTAELVNGLLAGMPSDSEQEGVELLTDQVPPGVDPAAAIKARFLASVATGEIQLASLSRRRATFRLGTMLGGFNVEPLIALLDDNEVGDVAVEALRKTILIFANFELLTRKAEAGSIRAGEVLKSWAAAEWFTSRPAVPQVVELGACQRFCVQGS
nr:hypothetical protein [Cupriavidus taiwanensis]